MERQHLRRRQAAERLARPPDLGRPGEEDQHVAVGLLAQDPLHRRRHALLQAQVARRLLRREELERHREGAALRAERRCAEEARHRLRLEGGRHHHQLEIGPLAAGEPAQQRERQVAIEVALVELVQHHRRHAGERGVGEEPPGEERLGQVADARARPRDVLEPDLPADRLSGPLAQLFRYPPRRHAGGEPPRLQHHDLARPGQARLEERAGDPRRLARAGRRLQYERRSVAQSGHHLRQEGVDGEGVHRWGSTPRWAPPHPGPPASLAWVAETSTPGPPDPARSARIPGASLA